MTCPRCGKMLLNDYDSVYCLSCGEVQLLVERVQPTMDGYHGHGANDHARYTNGKRSHHKRLREDED